MGNPVNSTSAISQADAPQASANLSQKFKSVFSKVVSTLADTLFARQIISEARLHKIPIFAAIVSLVVMGPIPTMVVLGGLASVKKLFVNGPASAENQPLLAAQKKAL